MLTHLLIENLMLIERVSIDFESPFVAITGESGSGKSSLMEALKLALGTKFNHEMLRRGQSSGTVRACFDCNRLDNLTQKRLKKLFEESFLLWPNNEPLIITRHFSSQKVNKAWLGDQPITQALLFRIGQELVEVIDSGASFSLENLETHQECLDSFAGVEEIKDETSDLWSSYQQLLSEKEYYTKLQESSDLQKSLLTYQVEEIESAELHEEEEAELLERSSRLASAHQIQELLQNTQSELNSPSLTKLARYMGQIERFTEWSSLKPLLESLKGAVIQAGEASDLIHQLQGTISTDHKEQQEVEERLDLIQLLKKKYGSSLTAIEQFLLKAKGKLQELEEIEQRLSNLEIALVSTSQRYETNCSELSKVRHAFADDLSNAVIEVLKQLNMPHAHFEIKISSKPPSANGQDLIEFFLCPNPGEPLLSVRRFASGGEMARLFLALKILKAHKRIPPTLIFDEIDASIGGHSAAKLAEKLQVLSKNRQVICITHFSQVAEKASRHLVMEKGLHEGRTVANVHLLASKQQQKLEIQRMLGKAQHSLSQLTPRNSL